MSTPRDPSDDRRVLRVLLLGGVPLIVAVGVVVLLRLPGGEPAPAPRGTAMPPAASPEPRDPTPFNARFTDVAADSGVATPQLSAASGRYLLPETMGSGVALGDLDSDGDPDLLLLSYGSVPALYRNDSPPGGPIRFTEVTGGSGLESIAGSTTAALGDVDGDGRLDLLVGTIGPDRLLVNQGGLRFREVDRFGDGWTSGAGFVDVDSDGDQDLVTCSYVRWNPEIDLEVDYTLDGVGRAYGPPTGFGGTDLMLYVNDGSGRMLEQGEERGLRLRRSDRSVPVMKALGLAFEDVDANGGIDVFVANDTTPNRLLMNDGRGVFSDAGARLGLAFDIDGNSTGAMGIDTCRDPASGRLMCAIGNFANEPSSFFVQGPGGGFLDRGAVSGIGAPTRPSLTFGTLFVDLDLDGFVDLLQVNGHIEPRIERVQAGQSYLQPAQVFRGGDDPTRFEPVPPEQLGDLATPIAGRAAASADLDGDGDLDLVVSRIDEGPLVLRNELDPAPGSILRVTIEDLPSAPDGEGSMVLVLDERGAVLHRLRLDRTRSYLTQSDPVGLFPRTEPRTAAVVRVVLPDGRVRSSAVPPGGRVVLEAAAPEDRAPSTP